MQKEARRVIERVQLLVKSSSTLDGAPAVKALGDENWIVRHIACVRLSVLGLKSETYIQLKANAVPGKQPLPAPDPLRKKAAAFARPSRRGRGRDARRRLALRVRRGE
jgi:hypothetical protein